MPSCSRIVHCQCLHITGGALAQSAPFVPTSAPGDEGWVLWKRGLSARRAEGSHNSSGGVLSDSFCLCACMASQLSNGGSYRPSRQSRALLWPRPSTHWPDGALVVVCVVCCGHVIFLLPSRAAASATCRGPPPVPPRSSRGFAVSACSSSRLSRLHPLPGIRFAAPGSACFSASARHSSMTSPLTK